MKIDAAESKQLTYFIHRIILHQPLLPQTSARPTHHSRSSNFPPARAAVTVRFFSSLPEKVAGLLSRSKLTNSREDRKKSRSGNSAFPAGVGLIDSYVIAGIKGLSLGRSGSVSLSGCFRGCLVNRESCGFCVIRFLLLG